jgi:5-methylcytosine-specific restriction endonuclease McrA
MAGENRVVRQYKRLCANKRGLQWRLSEEQAGSLFRSDCFYCGAPPSNIMRERTGDFVYNGIDRIDNELDYVPFNVVPCCGVCNSAKSKLGFTEFTSWIKRTNETLGVRLGRN